jgi:hypothetical protein
MFFDIEKDRRKNEKIENEFFCKEINLSFVTSKMYIIKVS